MTEDLLRFEDLCFRYPGAEEKALAGVSFSVPAGEALGLLGPNGAGKTTLMAITIGLLAADRGRVTLGDRPIAAARGLAPNLVALVPQDNAFYPMLTVLENLTFFGQVQGLGGRLLREREASALAFTQLEAFRERRADQLSGGLKRRLNLAIGLLADPAILLLDEPTVGVDPQSRHFLLEAIRGLQRSGRTIIYTSHYMEEVEALCSHVAILDQGRLVSSGPLGEVLASAPPVFSLRLEEALPEPLQAEWSMRHGLVTLPGHRIQLTGILQEETAALLAQARATGCVVDAWSWGQQHLDDVFLQLTRHALRDD
jgi:ABC-2 type transport system ATP-binding protein